MQSKEFNILKNWQHDRILTCASEIQMDGRCMAITNLVHSKVFETLYPFQCLIVDHGSN